MVLKILGATVKTFSLQNYWLPAIVSAATVAIVHAFVQGKSTTRERDLHGRIFLVTGGFSPLGMVLIEALAERGAHIIALSPNPIDSPQTDLLVNLLRSSTKNENIFAEECDLTKPNSIQDFCAKFLAGQDQRLDGIIFGHEYGSVGSVLSRMGRTKDGRDMDEEERRVRSLATFLILTLLLPALLVAPAERDIRIITIVNPFYAAAVPSFNPSVDSLPGSRSVLRQEGRRALKAAVFVRHLQRILDALPSAQVPKTDESSTAIPVVSEKAQKSNIVAVSVSPGISRLDTISPLMEAGFDQPTFSWLGVVLYIILQPFLYILTRSSKSALQTVLHALFLPTPFKVRSTSGSHPNHNTNSVDEGLPDEVLKPGALYSNCAVVPLRLPLITVPTSSSPPKPLTKGSRAAELPDEGELGGELAGRLVWEALEEGLREWEKANLDNAKRDGTHTPPNVNVDH